MPHDNKAFRLLRLLFFLSGSYLAHKLLIIFFITSIQLKAGLKEKETTG